MTNTITREQIRIKMASNEPMIIIEALPQQYFDAEHIPGAINIPHDKIKKMAAEVLPDKDAFIVVYCASTECQNSNIATQTLHQMGYSNAFEYIEGKQHWINGKRSVESSK